MNRDKLISAEAVCAYFGVCRRTVERWLRNRSLGFPRPTVICRRRYWSWAAIERWAEERQAPVEV